MREFLEYILQSSLLLIAAYIIYKLLLDRGTSAVVKRIALLGFVIVSLTLPLCRITIDKQIEVNVPTTVIDDHTIAVNEDVINIKDDNKALLFDWLLFLTVAQIELEIFEYIEIWYNKARRHSALRNMTIDEFWNLNKFVA